MQTSIALFEPFVVPGLDKGLLKLLLIASVVCMTTIVVTISSIIGLIRAGRRRRQQRRSPSAVILAAIASLIMLSWLLYWMAVDMSERSNPFNALLGINLLLCALPFLWLFAAVYSNVYAALPGTNDKSRRTIRERTDNAKAIGG
jgi:amino acid transporter